MKTIYLFSFLLNVLNLNAQNFYSNLDFCKNCETDDLSSGFIKIINDTSFVIFNKETENVRLFSLLGDSLYLINTENIPYYTLNTITFNDKEKIFAITNTLKDLSEEFPNSNLKSNDTTNSYKTNEVCSIYLYDKKLNTIDSIYSPNILFNTYPINRKNLISIDYNLNNIYKIKNGNSKLKNNFYANKFGAFFILEINKKLYKQFKKYFDYYVFKSDGKYFLVPDDANQFQFIDDQIYMQPDDSLPYKITKNTNEEKIKHLLDGNNTELLYKKSDYELATIENFDRIKIFNTKTNTVSYIDNFKDKGWIHKIVFTNKYLIVLLDLKDAGYFPASIAILKL